MIRPAAVGAAGDILHGSVIATGFGTTADCANRAEWILNTGCWDRSREAWEQMRLFDVQAHSMPAPVPPPAVPLATSGQAVYPGSAEEQRRQFEAETTDVLREAQAQYRRELQLWAQTQPEVTAPDWWDTYKFWIIGAAAGAAIAAVSRR